MVSRLIRFFLGLLGVSVKRRKPGIRRNTSVHPGQFDGSQLMETIHGEDIYSKFDFLSYPDDVSGWGGESEAFKDVLAMRPQARLIVEVGSWKGASAITMANHLEQSNLEARLLCIDTWLGALEFWSDQSDPERFQSLRCKHGFPQVYYQFLANVCRAGHQGRIIPFPIDSATGALWLMRFGVVADVVYLDGSHEEEAVYQDILDYSAVLQPDGLLFGDDWAWDGVRAAVEQFAREEKKSIHHVHDKWVLECKSVCPFL